MPMNTPNASRSPSLCRNVDSCQPTLLSRSPLSLAPHKTPPNVFSVTKTSATGPRRGGALPEPKKEFSPKDLCPELSQSRDDDYLPCCCVVSSSLRHQDLHHHTAEWWKQQTRAVALYREQRQAKWIRYHRRTAGRRADEDSVLVLPRKNFRDECIAFFSLQIEVANREWLNLCRLTQDAPTERRAILARQLMKAHWREQRRVATGTILQYIQQWHVNVDGAANPADLQFLGGLRHSV